MVETIPHRHFRHLCSLGRFPQLQTQFYPNGLYGGNAASHVLVRVAGGGGEAQSLGSPIHGWVIDRLNIDAMLVEQQVGSPLA